MSDKRLIRAREVMKIHFNTVDGMMTVSEALAMMHYKDTKCLIVDKRHANDEYGIMLISDVARKVLAADRAPERVNVYEVMAKPLIGADPDMDIRYCARSFDRFVVTGAGDCPR